MTTPELYQQLEICSGGEYDGYTQPGVYIDTIYGMPGECDTVRHLTLSFAPPIQSFLNYQLCPGDDYYGHMSSGVYIDTFSNTGGCDSIRTVALLVGVPEVYVYHDMCSGGHFEGYTQPGVYTDTLHGTANACDTIRHLTLTVSPPIVTSLTYQACYGID